MTDRKQSNALHNQAMVKVFKPQCSVLNDNDSGIDHLGTAVYAQALAKQIEHIETPVTFGIFARWGTGKSFLLKHIQSILEKRKKQIDITLGRNKPFKSYHCIRALSLTMVVLTLVAVIIYLLIKPPFTDINSVQNFRIALSAILVFFVLILALRFSCSVRLKKYGFHYKMVLGYANFTKLPILKPECNVASATKEGKINLHLAETVEGEDDEKDGIERRYIFVNFNAWKYAGSDNLWAGIVLTLADKIEEEFSSITTRIFRSINLEKIVKGTSDLADVYIRIDAEEDEVRKIAEAYGVVLDCTTYSNWKKKNKKYSDDSKEENGWVVKYIDINSAQIAVNLLKSNTFEAEILNKLSNMGKKETENKKKGSVSIQIDQNSINKTRPSFVEHFHKHPKKHCYFQDLYCILCLILTFLLIPIAVTFATQHLTEPEESDKEEDDKSLVAQILAWLPAGAALLYAVGSACYSMIRSQTSRVEAALKGVEGNLANELGFMHKVKEEVEYMTDLIHTVEFIYNVKYRVIITIDDLDRIPLPRIRSVLEAVNILLSDRSSPFVCLIAVDSRVAVESLEKNERDDSNRAKISGHEYLKKIINMPFCLPEITNSDKKNYVAGLIDKSDMTSCHYRQEIQTTEKPSQPGGRLRARNVRDAAVFESAGSSSDSSSSSNEISPPQVKKQDLVPLKLKNFQAKCRQLMLGDFLLNHLEGNPRSIKRIFNVISMTSLLIKCHQDIENNSKNLKILAEKSKIRDPNKQKLNESTNQQINDVDTNRQTSLYSTHVMHNQLAKNIVTWVILTDQWPYRASYILQVIEDSDQRNEQENKKINDNRDLFSIYTKYVIPEINTRDKDILNLDGDPDLFRRFLQEQHLTKGCVKALLKYTINLDQGLRNMIAIDRSVKYLEGEQQTHRELKESKSNNKDQPKFNKNLESRRNLKTNNDETKLCIMEVDSTVQVKEENGMVELDGNSSAETPLLSSSKQSLSNAFKNTKASALFTNS